MNEKERLKEEYFLWLCKFVGCHHRRELLRFLFETDFRYNLPMDGNRYEDGVNLRYRFADENNYHYRFIAAWLDDRDCSVLEMMVALALRIEEHITGDPELGDQTARWFEDMLSSMNLWYMTDDKFNEGLARRTIELMMDRAYKRNGDGGLFYLPNTRKDLRRAEIWYQAMWYLDEALGIK